jgi:hypothetical protein
MWSERMIVVASALCAVTGFAVADGESQSRPAVDSRSASTVIEAPRKPAATIDGVLSLEEWEGAIAASTADGGELMLMHDGDSLFVGIRSRRRGYGSLCLGRPDEILVLHSSAALGTAVYRKEGGHWKRARQFSYCCRAREESAERQELLRKDGWMASIGLMGSPEEMEYQLALKGDEVPLAVVYQMGTNRETAHWWPESLEDDCLGLTFIEEDPPEVLDFFPETWLRVRIGRE